VVILLFVASLLVVRLPTPLGSIIVPDDYSSIQTAVDHALAGQTIYVKNGIYTEQYITINKPLLLIGENPNDTILVGINYEKYSPPYVIQISADNVKVSGFTITNGSLGGIRVETIGSDTQPIGCVISGNNIVNNNNDGISTYDGKALTISNNNISNNSVYGIYDSSSQSIISNNYIAENGAFGVIVDSCNDVSINHNIIEQNGNLQNSGEQGGICLRWFGNFDVYANNITSNIGDGVQFSEGCSNSIVHDNNIKNNGIGVNLFNFAISNNSENIGIGLDNKVYRNNLSNYQNAFIETDFAYGNISNIYYAIGNGTDRVSWDNGKEGNYWSDNNGHWTYAIDENNVDHHPLTQQVSISVDTPTLKPSPTGISITIPLLLVIAAIVFAIFSFLLFKSRHKTQLLISS
jgi:hypothetical protein